MALGLPSRVSWFFLLLFGEGVGSPASINEHEHLYSGWRRSAVESSLGLSRTESRVPLPPLVTLRHEPKPREPPSAAGAPPPPRPRTRDDTVGNNSNSDPQTLSSLRFQYLDLAQKTPDVVNTHSGPAKLSSQAQYPVSESGTSSFTGSRFLQRNSRGQNKGGFSLVLPAFFPAHIVPPRSDFPDLKLWESRDLDLVSGELSHMPPPSFLIQTRKSYQRAREILSHSTYSNDFNHLQLPVDMKTQHAGEFSPGEP